jgi:hypothetical protein
MNILCKYNESLQAVLVALLLSLSNITSAEPIATAPTPAAVAPNALHFTFDFELARIVCKLLSTGDFNNSDIGALRAHPATPAMVRKMRMKNADEFIAHLQVLAKKPKTAETAARLLAEFNRPGGTKWAPMADAVVAQLKAYVPAQFSASLKVYFVFGIGSGGFAFDDVPDDVYVTLSEAPLQDVIETVAHELFHAVQTHVMTTPPRTNVIDAAAGPTWMRRLLYDLVQEATAELFTHPVAERPAGAEPNPTKLRFEKNRQRMRGLTVLFETVAWRLLLAPPGNEDAYDGIYGLLFYGNYDSPAYDLGWLMAKTIENKNGKAAIFALLKDDPKQFVLHYQVLAQQDPALPKFSEDFILRLKTL